MDSNLSTQARTLPLHEAGPAAGQDIGLRIALEELCGEMARQDDAAIVASADPYAQDARTFEAASSALL